MAPSEFFKMEPEEVFLILEAKQQALGKLTYADYDRINQFVQSRPATRPSIRHGKKR
jgi:hypothetical protein